MSDFLGSQKKSRAEKGQISLSKPQLVQKNGLKLKTKSPLCEVFQHCETKSCSIKIFKVSNAHSNKDFILYERLIMLLQQSGSQFRSTTFKGKSWQLKPINFFELKQS